MSFDQRQFSGSWWEVARLANHNPPSGTCPPAGLQSANFANRSLLWNFTLKNEDYYSLSLEVYDEDAVNLEKTYRGVAVAKNDVISLSLYDAGQAIELGSYTILTIHEDLAMLGKKSLIIEEEVITHRTSTTREHGVTVERDELEETEGIGGCQDDELIIFSREPVLTPTQRDTMLVSAEYFGFDGSQLISSHPTVIEPDIVYLPRVVYSNPGEVRRTVTHPARLERIPSPIEEDIEEEVIRRKKKRQSENQ